MKATATRYRLGNANSFQIIKRSRLSLAYIYKIINDVNDKIYIGKTECSIEKRFKEHCKDAFKERNEKRPLYAAMKKYGIDHFHIEEIEQTDSPEEREQYWIEYYGSFKYGYNATLGGDGKHYLDYELIFSTYQKLQNLAETARCLSISTDTVKKVVLSKGGTIKSSAEINKEKTSKTIQMWDKNNEQCLQFFSSIADAARFLIANQYSKSTDIKALTSHIRACANGTRKTAYGFIWHW